MNELLVGLCGYLAFSGSGNTACRVTTSQVYNQSIVKTYFDGEQHELERYGLGIYHTVPLNQPLGFAATFGYEVYKKDFKLPLTNNVNVEYSNSNTYTCNLTWSF